MTFTDILKLINLCAIVLFYRQYKKKEEEKDPNTWYTVNNEKSRYKGEWKNGVPHGQGAYYYETGEYHKGNFKESKFHGVGYHYYVKVNKTWVGEFENDNLSKGRFIDGKIDEEYEDYEFDEYEFRGEQLRRLRGYNKKNDEETEDEYAERILDMAYNEDKEEKRRKEEKIRKEEKVASLENEDMETLYIYDFEGTGEQLRRLRAYNKKNDEETEHEYTNRIWNMADKEDEEEKLKKAANEIVVDEPLEKDVNAWFTIEDGKARYKGEWKNGLPNGKGIKHIYKTDSYIEGNFVDAFAHGYGKQSFEKTWEKTVPYYEGEFKRNQWEGKGEYHYGDGDYYKGMWKDSKYHGQGAAYSLRLNKTWVGEYNNDEKVEGNWVKGEI
jgi:hypothetical protein